ncbi:hypothetical protein AVEN_249888-1 [Araneus ventricosus]|uniref:Trophoblast glycoprotein n=1 Tax=Araneus ventricosus TaxID=182803 RepID=A0A4Y2MRZ3_ARAVE|nr:hypothetical protein AVEN_249888-1 [Araneus ventricosus]
MNILQTKRSIWAGLRLLSGEVLGGTRIDQLVSDGRIIALVNYSLLIKWYVTTVEVISSNGIPVYRCSRRDFHLTRPKACIRAEGPTMVTLRFVVITQFLFVLAHRLSWAFSSTECPSEFQGMCKCGYVSIAHGRKQTYVVNCTNEGFDNTIMLRSLPPETEVLIFVGNEIKDLPLNVFGQETIYDKLHTIDFSNNHIQTIKGRTFHNVANVTKLILNDNDLYIVSKDHHPRMFSNFVNLRELHLRNAFTEKIKAGDYLNNLAEIFENSSLNHLRVLNMENNEISGIYHGEFCSLPALEELYLGDNHLKDIPMNFSCLKYLKMLDVGNNFIPYLSDQTIKSLENTKHLKLNLTANPFRCDCRMTNTYHWMKSTPLNLVNKEHFYCFEGFPPNVGKTVLSIHPNDFQCVPTLIQIEYHSSASIILTVGLLCLVVLLGVLIYKNRVTVGTYMHRAFQPIRSKFHYVSLERRDGTMDV